MAVQLIDKLLKETILSTIPCNLATFLLCFSNSELKASFVVSPQRIKRSFFIPHTKKKNLYIAIALSRCSLFLLLAQTSFGWYSPYFYFISCFGFKWKIEDHYVPRTTHTIAIIYINVPSLVSLERFERTP